MVLVEEEEKKKREEGEEEQKQELDGSWSRSGVSSSLSVPPRKQLLRGTNNSGARRRSGRPLLSGLFGDLVPPTPSPFTGQNKQGSGCSWVVLAAAPHSKMPTGRKCKRDETLDRTRTLKRTRSGTHLTASQNI